MTGTGMKLKGTVKAAIKLPYHAIAFMVRGIAKKWKQPVGYFLSSGPMPGKTMKTLLLMCIDKLRAIGLRPLVVVADQGSNNRNLFRWSLVCLLANLTSSMIMKKSW